MTLPWLPLQTGATALSRVVFGAAALVSGLGLFGEYSRRGDGALGLSFLYLYFLPIIAVVLRAALGNERASDVVLLPDELRIQSGPHHGVRAQWTTVRAIRVERGVMRLDLGDGVVLDLAHTDDAAERQSLDSLEAVLSAQRRRSKRSRKPTKPLAPALVSCAACGAPTRLADAATMPCEACGADTAIPAEIRARIVAGKESARAATSRAVAALFAQPPASRVNALLIVLATLGFAWLPLAAAVTGFGPTVLVSIALFLAGALALRVVIANRRALSIVCLGFAAKLRDDVLACRSCGGPLPEGEGSEIVATCVYCEAENVVAAPPTEKGGTAAETERLELAIAARDRAVRAALSSTLLGLALVGVALGVVMTLHRG